MRVEFLQRILEDGTKTAIVVNLDCVCTYSENLTDLAGGAMKGKTTLTLSNGLVCVVNKSFKEFQTIMSQERK